MESLRTKVEEHLTCAICLEQFKDPKVLPCLHSYCHECIVKLDKTGDSISCPECRMTVEVGNPPDISFLPSNFFVKNLLATLSLVSETDSGNVICENCDSADTAKTRCEKCNRYLCQFCTDSHKRFRDTKDHVLKSLEELKVSDPWVIAETVLCSKHKDEVVKLYCTTCQTTICRDCTIVDHRQHDFSFVEDVAKEKKEELLELLNEVKERKTRISTGLTKVLEREDSLDAHNKSTVAEITAYFENVAKSLDVRKDELIEKATAVKDAKQKQLETQREGLETTLSSCQSNIEFTEQAFKNGNNVQVLNMKKYISQSLETLKNTKSQIDPCVDDHIEFVAELSTNDIMEKLVGSLAVVDTEVLQTAENYTACFSASVKWLTVGLKFEITISRKGSVGRCHQLHVVFSGVAIKDVSVSKDDDDEPHSVSFVPLEVGVLKFEMMINGRRAPGCTLNKGVKWTLQKRKYQTSVGDCIIEYGVHTWKISVDHSECGWDQRADFKVGIINYDNHKTKYCLSGFAKSMRVEIFLKLDMSTRKLDITPSWRGSPSSFSVDCSRVSPFFEIDCKECDATVVEMGPFSF